MQKPKSKVVTGLLAGSLVLGSVFPAAAFAADNPVSPERLAGLDRFATAAAVAEAGWHKGDTDVAILAPGNDANLVDALTAAPLAKAKDAPILLTDGDTLPQATKDALDTLGITKVITVSGVIGDGVKAALGQGITVDQELGGADRFETAAKIAAQLQDVTGVMVTTAYTYADALSVASVAAAKNMPILLADSTDLPKVEADYLASVGDKLQQSYVLGGKTVVGDEVKDAIPHAEGKDTVRIAGNDRYATNLDVLKTFTDLSYNKVYVANGDDTHLVDALVASSLAAKTSSPIVLADKDLNADTQNFVLSQAAGNNLVALGGDTLVSNNLLAYNHVRPQDFGVMQLSGVNGYNVGFQLVDGKTSADLQAVVVTLYKGDKPLAVNVSTNNLLALDVTTLSSPFNIDGDFNTYSDPYWYYSPWGGTTADVPDKAKIDVLYQDGSKYTVINDNLSGDPSKLAEESYNHVQPQDFGVMQLSGVNGYTVGFGLLDGLKAKDLQGIKVDLYKGDQLLAENVAEPKLFVSKETQDATQLSSPFNINGSFAGDDGYWQYGPWQGQLTDVPDRAVITVVDSHRVFTVENKNLTGDPARLAAPTITSDLKSEVVAGETQDFNVTTAVNSYAANLEADKKPVVVKVTLTDGDKQNVALQYEEAGTYHDWALDDNGSAIYGPQTGFPFTDATSKFKVTFNAAGTYSYKLEVMTVESDPAQSQVLASTIGTVTVTAAAAQ